MGNIIIIFADGWGSRYGGINSLNFDFCMALGKINKCKVVCLCADATSQNRKHAKENNIELISVPKEDFIKEIYDFKEIIGSYKTDQIFWVGHDIKTGHIAKNHKIEYAKGKLVVFNHMGYAETYKPRYNSVDSKAKIEEQDSILKSADYIFSVGPKLFKYAQDRVLGEESQPKIFQYLPGLSDIKPNSDCPNNFSAISFGRIEENNDIIKQTILALRAFSKYSTTCQDLPTLTLFGATSDASKLINDEKDASIISEEEANAYVNCYMLPYTTNKAKLFDELKKQSVSMMLSLTEGFGLVGLESISAGVPLIISKNSGLYEYLKNQNLEYLVHGVHIESSNLLIKNDDDINKVSRKIEYIAKNNKSAKKRALILLNELKDELTWHNSALKFLTDLKIINLSTNFPLYDSKSCDSNLIANFEKSNFEFTKNKNAAHFKAKFETQGFYNILLDSADKRLWIWGRKNKKLFSNDNRLFFQDLDRKIKNGFDFRCLFLNPESETTILKTAQNDVLFVDNLINSINNAKNILMKNNVNFESIFGKYSIDRDAVIIIIDNYIIYSEIGRDTEGVAMPITGSEFYILDIDTPTGKNAIKKFESVWKNRQ